MVRFLINTLIFFGSAALGLWITSMVVDGFTVDFTGLIVAAVIFTIAQWILSPLIFKMASKYANAFLGGVGLVSTFVALLITSLFVDGLSIDGVGAWIAGTVLVWLVTALATWVLPMIFLKKAVDEKRS